MTEITNIQLVKKLGFWIPWTLWMIVSGTMTENRNNQFTKNLGLWIFWIVSGLIWIKTGSVIFMILPIIYTTRRNKEIWR